MRFFFRFWLPVLAYMGLIFYLSSKSQFPVEVPDWMYYWDKFVHAAIFGFLGFLFLRAWTQGKLPQATFTAFFLTILFTALYGASDEFHQQFVPGRTPDIEDVIADTAGAIVVCIAVYAYHKYKVDTSRATE